MTDKLNINDLVDNHPLSASVLSKLVIDKNDRRKIDYSKLNYDEIAKSIESKIKTNEDIIKLFPDTELAMQIVTTSIISPNDLTTTSLKLTVPEIPLPSTIKNQVLDTIENYIDKNYDFYNKVYNIVKEALFTKGAYVEVCIPEASLDRLINGDLRNLSIESYNIGYEDKIFNRSFVTANLATESFDIANAHDKKTITIVPDDFKIDFTEDISILKYSDFKLKKLTTENRKYQNTEEQDVEKYLDSFFKVLNYTDSKPVEFVLRQEENIRESLGMPFISKVPVEAVIPVYSSNDCTKHVGYFILLDENGNFLDMKREKVDMANCNNYINKNFREMLIDKAKRNLDGFEGNVPEINDMENVFNNVIEELIKNRLRNSKYEDLVDIGKSKDIYKVMLSRSLKNKRTKILFVPMDLLQYYAFNYRNNGTGESLIEQASFLYSIAAISLMAGFVANIQNSIPQTEVGVTIDEHETDLAGAMSKAQDNILKLRQANYPIGITDMNVIVNWIQRAGLKFNYDNPNLPNTKIDMRSSNLDKAEANQEFLDFIIDLINKSFGVTPEMVSNGNEKEFATSISHDNMLFAKRIINWQTQLEPMLTRHIRMILNNDGIIKERINNIILGAKKEIKEKMKDIAKSKELIDDELEKVKDKYLVDYITDFFLNNIEANLARPEFTDNAAMMTNLDSFINKVEKLTDMLISSDKTFLGRFYKNLGESSEELKSLIQSELVITYLQENNIMPELTSWFTMDENGKPINPIFDNHLGFASNTIKQYNNFLKELYNQNKELIPEYNTKVQLFEKIEEIEGGSDFGGSDDFGSDDSDSSDDFGMDDSTDDTGDDLGDDLNDADSEENEDEDLDEMTVEDVQDEEEEKDKE